MSSGPIKSSVFVRKGFWDKTKTANLKESFLQIWFKWVHIASMRVDRRMDMFDGLLALTTKRFSSAYTQIWK